jgi:fructosamine-3-kinase
MQFLLKFKDGHWKMVKFQVMKVLEHATEILDTHKIKPSLLHGDLWVNYLFMLCWSIFWELELEMAQYWTLSSREKLSVGETTL